MTEKSEFGSGLAICLVKFSEHAENKMAREIANVQYFNTKFNANYDKLENCDINFRRDIEHFDYIYGEKGWKHGLSNLIESWANGATDHLYDIEVPKQLNPRTKLVRLVKKLKSKGLECGHGFTKKVWTYDDFNELIVLTRDIAIELDKKVGLKPDLGKW